MKTFNKPEDFLFESFFTNEQIKYKNKLYTIQEILMEKDKTTLTLISKNLKKITVTATVPEITQLFQPTNV